MVYLIFNLVCSLLMTGVIWFVQIVHYPLFHKVSGDTFKTYEKNHQKLTSFVVVPLMLGESASAVLMIIIAHDMIPSFLMWINFLFVVAIWAVTFSVQVPLHRKLANGYDSKYVDLLVRTNSIRVVLWTVKSALVIYLLKMMVS